MLFFGTILQKDSVPQCLTMALSEVCIGMRMKMQVKVWWVGFCACTLLASTLICLPFSSPPRTAHFCYLRCSFSVSLGYSTSWQQEGIILAHFSFYAMLSRSASLPPFCSFSLKQKGNRNQALKKMSTAPWQQNLEPTVAVSFNLHSLVKPWSLLGHGNIQARAIYDHARNYYFFDFFFLTVVQRKC